MYFPIKNIPVKILVELQDYIDWESLLSKNFHSRIFPEPLLLQIKKENLSLDNIGKTIGFSLHFFIEYTGFDYTEFLSADNKITINGAIINDAIEISLYAKNLRPYVEKINWEALAEYGKFKNQTQIGNFFAFLNKSFSGVYFLDSDRVKKLKMLLVFKNRFISEELKNQMPEIKKIIDKHKIKNKNNDI